LVAATGHFKRGAITLAVNGTVKQIANLSQYYELFPGDIIYSGTPENVGPVLPGDVMLGHIDGLPDIRVKVL
jgi:fumarylpyruvate hydrolase